jgi:hypothetical protein
MFEHRDALSRLPLGFLEVASLQLASVQTVTLLVDVSNFTRMFEEKDRGPSYHEAFLQVVEATFLIWRQTKSTVERYLCQGLVAYVLQLRWSQTPALFTLVPTTPLWLLEDFPGPAMEPGLAIWVVLNVASTLSLDSLFSPRAVDAVTSVLHSYPENQEWEKAFRNIQRFFHPEALLTRWKTIWTQSEARRRYLPALQAERQPVRLTETVPAVLP